jgi:hypothetical protein
MASYLIVDGAGNITSAVIVSENLNTPETVAANTPAGMTSVSVPDGSPAIFQPMNYKVVGGQVQAKS